MDSGALFNHQPPTTTKSWTHGAACRHNTTTASHIRYSMYGTNPSLTHRKKNF